MKISYNPAIGAFEARVDVQRGTRTFRYPCQVHAPITSDMASVRQRLELQALRMSDSSPSVFSAI